MISEKEVLTFLRRGKGIDRIIRAYSDEIKRLEILAKSCGGFSYEEKVQKSPSLTARFESYIQKAVDKSKELEVKLIEKEQVLSEIMKVIDSLEDTDQQAVLIYKYVEGLPFYKVYRKANLSKSSMYRVHDKAIKALAKNWEKVGKNL